jgi:hypothetical protein
VPICQTFFLSLEDKFLYIIMVKFATFFALFSFSQSILGVRAEISKNHDVGSSPLRGGLKEQATRSLVNAYDCNLCSDPSNDYSSVPAHLETKVVTLTSFGQLSCKGFYDAALAGGVISSQNECNSLKNEFSRVCCNDADVAGETIAATNVPGPVGTPPPSVAPVGSPAPTMSNSEKSCAALTNSTGNCGGGDRANGLCSDRSCCSQYGWCGTAPEYCNTDPLHSSRGGAKAITQDAHDLP